MNNAVFRKTLENLRKHRNTKLITTERRRSYLVSGANFHTTKFLTEIFLAIGINNPVYLGIYGAKYGAKA